MSKASAVHMFIGEYISRLVLSTQPAEVLDCFCTVPNYDTTQVVLEPLSVK